MSLTRKTLSTSKSRFLAWLCCSPCMISGGSLCGLIACLTCGNACQEQAVDVLCFPCADSPLDKTAHDISFNSLSYSFMSSSDDMGLRTLEALDQKDWKGSELFTKIAVDEQSMEVYKSLKNAVYLILNEYNFGRIESTQLMPEDTKFIGNLLRTAIFTKLPTPESFFENARGRNIDVNNAAALNGFLLGTISSIMTNEFLLKELNTISVQLVANKEAQAARLSANRSAQFAGFSAAQTQRPVEPAVNPASEREYKPIVNI